MTYPNRLLDSLAKQLVEDWIDYDLTANDVRALCADLFAEAQAIYEDRAEEYWADAYDPQSVASRQASYEETLIAAGRGHLLKG